MADPVVGELEAATKEYIWPNAVTDNFFRGDPVTAYFRQKALTVFPGGRDMRAAFNYAPLFGGAYLQGAPFNLAKPQTLSSEVFDPRFYEVNVTEFLEQIRVQNVGPEAAFSLVENDLNNAMSTISAMCGVNLALDGQQAGRLAHINGWDEAYQDGITPGWQGVVFPLYGKNIRNGAIGDALNSIPRWAGTKTGDPAPITYDFIADVYQDCVRGNVEPDLIAMNKRLFAGCQSRIQVQQRFAQEKDPIWGASGFRINNAMVLKSDYFPSLAYGKNDGILGNYLTGTFVVPAGASAQSNLPTAGTTVTVGEVMTLFNIEKWLYWVARDPLFAFGFTGFKTDIGSTKVAGQVLTMNNAQNRAPWSGKQCYGLA
jgi:hypothetical protein